MSSTGSTKAKHPEPKRSGTKHATKRIEPRKRPQQERSQEMVERILETAQKLLKEAGIKGLTTIAIADRAGLSVGSLYQYFPNKEAIILDLARRWLSAFHDVLDALRLQPPSADWRGFCQDFHAFTGKLAALYQSNANLLPILDALHSNQELRKIDQEHDAFIVKAHADWFMRLNPRLGHNDAERLGRIVLDTGHVCFTLAVGSPAERRGAILSDLERMHQALLQPHLGLK